MYLYGLLAYEMMTGVPAFPPQTPEIEQAILQARYREPTELSPEARDLIAKLIVTNPDHRLSIKKIKKHRFFN